MRICSVGSTHALSLDEESTLTVEVISGQMHIIINCSLTLLHTHLDCVHVYVIEGGLLHTAL